MMKLYAAPGLLRPTTATATATIRATAATTTVTTRIATRVNLSQTARQSPLAIRHYATTNAESKRRAVTPFNDDGHVPWTNLSAAEKTARATQQTFNFGMVIVGLVLTGGVGYFLYQEVLSPDSKTAYFNRAVDRIKKDPRCLELLGDAKKIAAFGEETQNKWRRARPIASTLTTDSRGNDHLMMHFNVQGPKAAGQVALHLVKRAGHKEFEYRYFFVDVKSHRIYLENADAAAATSTGKDGKGFKLFGIPIGK